VTDLDRQLDRLVPEPREKGDWGRVLADSERSRSRRLSLALPLVGVAAAIAILTLAWPFGSERPAGILDRALAAIGEGSALHIVYRGDWGPMSVDLSTGEVEPVVAESEVWYDPKRGVHEVWRLGGEVTSEHLVPIRELSARQEEQLVALADNYRDALQSGKARVIGPGRVEGRPVFWIRVRSEWLPDTSDGRNHLFAEEVAVDRETYEPVYARSTRDGRPPPGGGGQAIIELEQISADDADFDVEKQTNVPSSFMGGTEFGKLLEPAEFSDALGGQPFWLGASHHGKPLAEAREFVIRRRADRNAAWEETQGLYLFYGTLRRRTGTPPLRALSQPAVELEQFREPPRLWIGWAVAPAAREGRIVISGNRSGFVLREGTYISVRAPSVREILEAAAELRGVGEPAPPRSAIDFAEVARQVEARQGQSAEVSGGRPLRPRPIARSRGKLVQAGENKGVTVRLFSGGVARIDTRGMEPRLQRVLPRTLSWGCFRVRGDQTSGGGIGPIPRNGAKWATVLGHGSRGRLPILRPPFDGCELGAGVGRNWLPRFNWHGPLELPLTARGRRFFEERAAARELAHFVRNGPRQRARKRMKAGASAPPARLLHDRERPYIAVTSGRHRFRASLTASTGRRFFIEIVRGRIGSRNVGLPLAFVR
jgi:hypothetical protein